MADHRHARLSPSASHRWLTCPASVRMEQTVESTVGEITSVYADEGTMAHTRAEIEAAYVLGLITKKLYNARLKVWASDTPEEYQEDMSYHAKGYAAFVKEQAELFPHSKVLLEQRVESGVPGCWGTADATIVGMTHVQVIDYKYGGGIWVDARENSQLMLYGVGALEEYGDVLGETELVKVSIYQPRMDNISHYEISAKELRAWRDNVVKPTALEALGEHARFNPSEEACRFCSAAGECKPRAMRLARADFGDPDLLTVEEIGELLGKISEIRHWCAALEDTALDKLYSQRVAIPGWKVVRSGGRRSITNDEEAIEALIDVGYSRDEVCVTKVKTLGDLEKLVGKKVLPEVLGDLLKAGEGKPSLVPEDDPRPSITPHTEAAKDFAEDGGE